MQSADFRFIQIMSFPITTRARRAIFQKRSMSVIGKWFAPGLLLLVALALGGCNDDTPSDKTNPDTPTQTPTQVVTPIEEQNTSPISVSSADLASLKRPDNVEPLSFEPSTSEHQSSARARNAEGLKLYSKKDYRGAIALYIEALKLDPGNLLARYNLSCAYNLNGEPEKGLALLNEFKTADCPICRQRLIRASEDADWHSMWAHPLFVEIVGVTVGETISGEATSTQPFWQQKNGCPQGTRQRGQVGKEIYCARKKTRGTVRQGPSATWHGSGNTLSAIGNYKDNLRVGRWKFFHPDGSLSETGSYRGGNKNGVWSEWYPTGTQSADGHYLNGQRHGRWTWFDTSGAISAQADYNHGTRGPWIIAPSSSPK